VMLIEGAPGFGKTRMLKEAVHRANGMRIRSGHGMADPLDRVVDLAPLLEALFDSDPPLLSKKDLNVGHSAPEQRFWLVHDLELLLEQATLDDAFVALTGKPAPAGGSSAPSPSDDAA